MTVITMSRNELTRLRVLIDIADGRLSVVDATELIDVGQMKIYRLLLVVTVVIVFFYVHDPNGYLLSLKVVAAIWAVAPPTWFAFEWYSYRLSTVINSSSSSTIKIACARCGPA